jgi:hypothetical protein
MPSIVLLSSLKSLSFLSRVRTLRGCLNRQLHRITTRQPWRHTEDARQSSQSDISQRGSFAHVKKETARIPFASLAGL